MRIEAYNQVQQMYNTSKTTKSERTNSASQTDKLQISNTGKEIQNAKAAVLSAPDIREDVTAPIKQRIQNGSYEVSVDSFAEKLLQKFDEMR